MRHAWLALALLSSCATDHFANHVYRDSEVAFQVGDLPARWTRFDLSGADLTFRESAGGTILVNGLCHRVSDLSLDVLTNQALFGVEVQHLISREPITLDGRGALRTQLTGTLDGVPIQLELVVMKKDQCTYDLQLVSGPDVFAARDAEFRQFVEGFHTLPPTGP